jgi:hypothetical protein
LGTSTYFWKRIIKTWIGITKWSCFSKLDFKKLPIPICIITSIKEDYFHSLKSKTSKNSISKAVRLLIYKWVLLQECFISDKMKIFSVQYQWRSIIQITNFRKGKSDEKPQIKSLWKPTRGIVSICQRSRST